MIGALLVISLIIGVSCTRQKQDSQSINANQKQNEQSAECSSDGEVPYKDFEIVICSNGDQFTSEKEKQWSGDNIKIYKQKGKEKTLLRDFAETAFGSTSGVAIEAKNDSLLITIDSEDYPDWTAQPLFTENISLDTGAASITPLVPVPVYDQKIVEKLWAEINKNEADMFPSQSREDAHQKFFDLAYTNLFKLRDYAFRNPQEIEKKLKALRKWDWNDGEVAEVYSQILSQVSYMMGKQVVLK
jgi:hypothetical protein